MYALLSTWLLFSFTYKCTGFVELKKIKKKKHDSKIIQAISQNVISQTSQNNKKLNNIYNTCHTCKWANCYTDFKNTCNYQ